MNENKILGTTADQDLQDFFLASRDHNELFLRVLHATTSSVALAKRCDEALAPKEKVSCQAEIFRLPY